MDPFNYSRRESSEVNIGATPLGGKNPIRIQSMTNTPTLDTAACVEQAKRIIQAGGEYVRLTTQGTAEAENLVNINIDLRREGYMTPLVADVHFNPRVAEVAARYAEKVRINPGNYGDISRFASFLKICKENHTAIRIGVNHGSLSERIMERYGDTPRGMVESCMEFLRICVQEDFRDVVVSVKSSNTVVMVKTVRMLIGIMEREDMCFPIHLGVTEAGDGEDGRIKSALGIGALLADGIGDTIRVSLSEAPEAEIPVARKLVDYITAREGHRHIKAPDLSLACTFLNPKQRFTRPVGNIGGDNVPVVIASRLEGDCTPEPSAVPDYLYLGQRLPEKPVKGMEYIVDADVWQGKAHTWPAFKGDQLPFIGSCRASMKFLFLTYMGLTDEAIACLRAHPEIVVVAQSNHVNRLGEMRALAYQMRGESLGNPVVFFQHYDEAEEENLQIKAAADMGPLVVDGLVNGVFLLNQSTALPDTVSDRIAFGILQAGGLRISKTEYISCPGCGRTLYDLQGTIARIKEATAHLKGLKIAIMGCIVNGPGEMADADYGYVGAGRGMVSLYKKKVCVEKNIPEAEAVDKLVELIKANGDWKENDEK